MIRKSFQTAGVFLVVASSIAIIMAVMAVAMVIPSDQSE